MRRVYKKISAMNYCTQELSCLCNDCNHKFTDHVALNYELVCFTDDKGIKYFLPTYGKYGYFYLLERLVGGWNQGDRITKQITDCFERELNKIAKHHITISVRTRCPCCNSYNVFVASRHTIANGSVNWVEIDVSNV